MNELLELYILILKSLDVEVGMDGRLLQVIDIAGNTEPVSIMVAGENKPVYLPTKAVMKSADWDMVYGFHLANESISDKQSDLLKWLTTRINFKLYNSSINLISALVKIKENKISSPTLAQEKLDMSIPVMTKSTSSILLKILKTCTGVSLPTPFIMLKLEKGKTIDGIKYDRSCLLLRPIDKVIESFRAKGTSNNALNCITGLVNASVPKSIHVGSNSKQAPYLEALLHAYYDYATHVNNVITTLGNYKQNCTLIDLSWYGKVDDAKLKRLVETHLRLPLPGNISGDNTNVGDIENSISISDDDGIQEVKDNRPSSISESLTSVMPTVQGGNIYEQAYLNSKKEKIIPQAPVTISQPNVIKPQPSIVAPSSPAKVLSTSVSSAPKGVALASKANTITEVIKTDQNGSPIKDRHGMVVSIFVNEHNQQVMLTEQCKVDALGNVTRTFRDELGEIVVVNTAVQNGAGHQPTGVGAIPNVFGVVQNSSPTNVLGAAVSVEQIINANLNGGVQSNSNVNDIFRGTAPAVSTIPSVTFRTMT